MMKRMTPIILLASLVLTLSCQIWERPDMDFTYPLEPGRTWTYQREAIVCNFATDSLEQALRDTTSYEVMTEVLDPITLNDSLDMTGIRINGRTSYYNEQDSGLFLVAYQPGDGEIILPKKTNNSGILFNNMYFSNVESVSDFLQQAISLGKAIADTIYLEQEPLKVLDYPLAEATEWYYGTDLIINKRVRGTKNITVTPGTFACYRIEWTYDLDNDGISDDDYWIDDYISEDGLIMRNVTVLNIEGLDEYTDVGTFDLYDNYVLTSYNK